MKPKTIIITLLGLLVLSGLLFLSYKKSKGITAAAIQGIEKGVSESALVASSTLYDFGTISMRKGDAIKDFIVKNPTDKDILVSTVVTSCMCTSAFVIGPDGVRKGPFKMPGMGLVPAVDKVIKAGESFTIQVVYDPNAHGPAGVGKIDRFVRLVDGDGGSLQLEILANVTP